MLLQVPLLIVVALVTALVLNRELKARSFWRAVFFFPVLLSPVVVGLIWRWILQRQGLLNLVLFETVGAEPHTWLTDRFWAFAAAVGVSIWAHIGFYTLILLAGLQAIPKDLYEAAEMDGTRPARVFWRITLPLLVPNLLVVLVLALIRAVQVFDEVYVLTGGGPGTSTMYLTQYIFETGFASQLRNPGLAAAASILMGIVLVVLTLMQLAASRASEKQGAAQMSAVLALHLPPPRRHGLALDRHRHLGVADRRALPHVRPGGLAGAVVLQDAGGARRVSADAPALCDAAGRRSRATTSRCRSTR